MKRWSILSVSCLLVVSVIAYAYATNSGTEAQGWAIQGTWTDSCCCKVSCPCLFGNKPTEGYCQGASLFEVETGHYRGVDLNGTAVVATYHSGDWGRFYVRDTASPEQVEALAAVLPLALPFLAKGTVEHVAAVPLTVERTDSTVKFEVPETVVELEMVEGANGKPIKLHNLPARGAPFPQAHDHTQYRSIRLEHSSNDRMFEWSGRNGFVSQVDLAGGDPS